VDAIYRLDEARVLYPDEAGIFGEVDPAESALQDRISTDVEAVLGEAGDAVCYAPLAIGHHVDHQVVRDVGLVLAEKGRRVLFYEDFPYVWWEIAGAFGGRGEAGRRVSGNWQPTIRSIDVEPKIVAIACYRSQVADLFGSEEAMAEAVRAYAWSVGVEHYAERYWCFGQSAQDLRGLLRK